MKQRMRGGHYGRSLHLHLRHSAGEVAPTRQMLNTVMRVLHGVRRLYWWIARPESYGVRAIVINEEGVSLPRLRRGPAAPYVRLRSATA